MAKREMSEHKPKRRSRVGMVVLIILLLLAAAGGFLFYSAVKAPLALDDPRNMAAQEPMPAEERFRFSAADGTVQIKVCAADIWNLIMTHVGEDFLDIVNRETAPYSLSVSGCSIQIDEKGPRLDLEVFYQDMRLVVKVPCTLEVSGQHFSFKPAGVKLGVLPLPVGNLLSSVKLEYDFQLPVISSMTGVSYEKDAIVIAGTMDEDIRSFIPKDVLYRIAVFSEPMQPLVDCLETEEGYRAILSHLEQNPGDIEAFYNKLFMLAGSEITDEYLESHMGITQRMMPGIDYSTLDADREALLAEIEPYVAILERLFTSVVSDYNGKVFNLSDGEFLKKLKPFHPTNYGTGSYDALYEVLNPDDFFLVLVRVEDGFIRKTPSFYKLADENQQFTQPVDFDRTYILGFVFRSLDGDPFLLYETETHIDSTYYRVLTLQPLTEDEVSALNVPGKFGVWTGRS